MLTLSVITVVKNDFAGLRKTRDSLLPVNGVSLQWIIVDGTPDMHRVSEIAASCLFNVLMINEPDSGPYDAMNKGIRKARGEWLLFLNAGDCLLWSKELSECLSRNDSTDIFIGTTNYSYLRKVKRKPIDSDLLWVYGMPACHQSMFFSNRSSLDLFYNTNYVYAADYEMLLRNIAKGINITPLDIDVALVNPYGISNRNQFAVKREHFHIAGAYKMIGLRQAFVYLWQFVVVLSADIYNGFFRRQK